MDADYKRIRGKVWFRDALPRNTSGKLLRREMRKWAEEVNLKEATSNKLIAGIPRFDE